MKKKKQKIKYKYCPCLQCGRVISETYDNGLFCSLHCALDNAAGVVVPEEQYYDTWEKSIPSFETKKIRIIID